MKQRYIFRIEMRQNNKKPRKKENFMKKLFLLFSLATLFVSCTRMNEDEGDMANPPINDNAVLPEESVLPTPLPNAETPTLAEPEISADKAKEIALARAGLRESEVTLEKVRLDFDDGVWKYEVEFKKGNIEYDVEVNAKDGKILSFEKD